MDAPRPASFRPALALGLPLAAALVAGGASVAQEDSGPTTRPAMLEAMEEITADELGRDVRWLADDARQGRGILTDGLDAAADYIAGRFETLGLEPAPGLDGYFQPFEREFGEHLVEDQTRLSAPGAAEMVQGVQFNPLSWSAPGAFEGELVFGGYSITSERYDYDDYADLDAQGKVVLAFRYEPHTEEGDSFFTNDERFSPEAALFAKARDAEEAGAVALLIVNPPNHHGEEDVLMEFGTGRRRTTIPVFHLTRQAAENLLTTAELPDLETLQASVDKGEGPASIGESGLTVEGGFESDDRTVTVKNVVAMLPGETDEVIVVGAHYDHVGLGSYGSSYGYGEIHNGADDNASGTSVMLALAEAFARRGEKPRRTILFAAFTAEEIGLIGSRYLAENPPVPLEKMVAMVNLDMVGRVREDTLYVGGLEMAEVYPDLVRAADGSSPLGLSNMGGSFSGRSDHASFNDKRVPALFFFSGLHEQYHSPADDPELINVEGMEQAAELVYDVIDRLMDTPRSELAFTEPGGGEEMLEEATPATRPQPARRARLGIMPSFTREDAGGVAVERVSDAMPAARAGIEPGDVIIRLGDHEIASLQDLQDALSKFDAGTETAVVVRRDGEEKTLQVRLESSEQD